MSDLVKAVKKVDEKERKKRKKARKRHRRNVMIMRFLCKVIPFFIMIGICVLIGYFSYPYYFIDGKYIIDKVFLFCVIPCIIVVVIFIMIIKLWFKWMIANEIW